MPNSYKSSFDEDPIIKPTRERKTNNMAMSVVPGQFIGNKRKLEKTKNLAQSVGFGLGEEGSLKALGSLRTSGGLLG